MRLLLILAFVSAVAGCSGDPRSYGITGPGGTAAPVSPAANTADASTDPGVSTSGSSYGPSNRPTSGSSGFWGYN